MKKTRSYKREGSLPKQIVLGSLLIWSIFIVFSLIFAVILYSGDNPTASTKLFSLISFTASGGLGSLLNKKIFSSDMNVPLFCAVLCALVYIMISCISSGKIYIGALISAVCFILISVIASLTKKKKPKRRAARH